MERGGTLSGVVHDARIARITVAGLPGGPATLARIFGPLAGAEISIDVIAESTGPDGTIELGFTVASDELATALPIIEGAARALGGRVAAQGDLAKVSLVGTGILDRLFATLAEAAIPCLMVSTSEISVTCVIPEEQATLAVARLHNTFRRDFIAPAPDALLAASGPLTAGERGVTVKRRP